MQDIDILPGNALGAQESVLIYLVNLRYKYVTLKNSNVNEKLQRLVFAQTEYSGIFENLVINMDKVQSGIGAITTCNLPPAFITEGEIIVKNSVFYGSA